MSLVIHVACHLEQNFLAPNSGKEHRASIHPRCSLDVLLLHHLLPSTTQLEGMLRLTLQANDSGLMEVSSLILWQLHTLIQGVLLDLSQSKKNASVLPLDYAQSLKPSATDIQLIPVLALYASFNSYSYALFFPLLYFLLCCRCAWSFYSQSE